MAQTLKFKIMPTKKSKTIFAPMYYNLPHTNAPDFVKASINMKVEEMQEFIDEHASEDSDYIRFQVVQAQSGKYQIRLNTFKPS
tara:strand:- start:2625 stop:2876 length:252 start_codon:yes stop_codon:yes gene_type:complete